MKKNNILSFLTELVLVCLLCFGSLGCLCSGFQLQVESSFTVICILWAVLCLICLRVKRGYLALLGLLALYGLRFWHQEHYVLFGQMLRFIGSHYYRAYGWDPGGWFSSADAYLGLLDMTDCFIAMGLVAVFLLSLTLRRRLPAVCCIPAVLLPVVLSLVITDTVPHEIFTYLFILGFLLLVLTHSTRRREAVQGARLTAMVLLPAALALLILFNQYPQSAYKAPSLEDTFFSFLLPRVDGPPIINPTATDPEPSTEPPVTLPPISITGSRVNLDMIGPNTQSLRQAMSVTSDLPGLMYLRGRSYGDYMGIMWDTDGSVEENMLALDKDYAIRQLPDGVGSPSIYQVSISDRYLSDIRYVPYYPTDGALLSYGSVLNPDGQRNYGYSVYRPSPSWQSLWLAGDADALRVGDLVLRGAFDSQSRYTKLTDSTRDKALALLEARGISQSLYLTDAARQIGDFVRGSAAYDLNTQKMPADEVDFALWFLTESDTGYCVHFATAAVVLLRSLGIPARYVEGYVANLEARDKDGAYTDLVLEKNAHAWAEYYVPDVGWVILEATPAEGYMEDPPAPTDPTDTQQPTLPPPTAPSSGTTAPTVPDTGSTGQTASVPTTQTPQTPGLSIPDWVWQTALGLAAALSLLLLQWLLRLKLRFLWLQKGDPRRRALRCWRYGRRLCRTLRLPRPDGLYALAQKASFSRDGVTEEELSAAFAGFTAEITAVLRKKNGFVRLLYRLVLAVY